MRTVVIRITEPKKSGGFPVELLTADSDDPSALAAVAGARATIPTTLDPEEPVTLPGGGPLAASTARTLYDQTTDESDVFAAIGELLYRIVARGKLKGAWAALRDAAAGAPTRTILDIAPGKALRELHALPWELMFDPDSGMNFFIDQTGSVLRGEPKTLGDPNPAVLPQARRFEFPEDDWPLRVLVVFGADAEFESGDATATGIGASAELRALETLFAASRFDVEYEVLEHPTRKAIRDSCDSVKPHILHFIGHAQAGARPEDHQLLIYQPGDGDTAPGYEPWTLFDIRNDLQTLPLRLAFLNACRTSAAAPGGIASLGVAPFASITESFLHRGALGVIGMQGDVPGDLAAEFSRVFYTAVVRGDPVDAAVREARWTMSQLRTNYVRRGEWSFPVLRTRVMPGLVLPRSPTTAKAARLVERFVGHVGQRRRVREAVHAQDGAGKTKGAQNGQARASSPNLVVIAGDPEVGKSHLAKWCAQVAASRGLGIVYVKFGTDVVDLLGALRWIRDGQRPPVGGTPQPLAGWPVPPSAFRRFNQKLNARMQGLTNVEGLPEPTADVTDDGVPLPHGASPDLASVEDTLYDFCRALEVAAKPQRLVLVLDQIEGIESTAREKLLPAGLFAPIARGDVEGVRAVLVTRTADYARIQATFNELSVAPTEVDVVYFQRSEFDRIVRQLCLQWSPEMYDNVRESLPKLLAQPKLLTQFATANGWKGGLLDRVDRLCQVFAP